MNFVLSQFTFLRVFLPTVCLLYAAASAHAQTLEELRDTIVQNSRRLHDEEVRTPVPDEDAEAARKVLDAAEKILADKGISESFRNWTIKRKSYALIPLAYHSTPEYYPLLDGAIDELSTVEGGAELANEIERHVLRIAIFLVVRPVVREGAKPIRIDVEALIERMIDFSRRQTNKVDTFNAIGMLKFLIAAMDQMPPTIRDKRLLIAAPPISEYFLSSDEIPFLTSEEKLDLKNMGEELQAVARRLTLPGRNMQLAGSDLEGNPFNVPLKNKVVLVHFWGTWCRPCQAEINLLIPLYEKYKDRGFEIVGVNTGIRGDERPSWVKRFIEETKYDGGGKITWPIIHESGSTPRDGRITLTKLYGIRELPITILIGRDGKVISVNPNMTFLEGAIQRALSPEVDLNELTDEERALYEENRRKEEEAVNKEIEAYENR